MSETFTPVKALRRGTSAIYKYYDLRPSELTLALVLFNGGRPKKLGRGLDEKLKQQLDGLLALLAEQVREATKKPFLPMVRIEAMALFTYLVGLLVLKHSGRIDVLGNSASVLLAHYIKNMVARLAGSGSGRAIIHGSEPPGLAVFRAAASRTCRSVRNMDGGRSQGIRERRWRGTALRPVKYSDGSVRPAG